MPNTLDYVDISPTRLHRRHSEACFAEVGGRLELWWSRFTGGTGDFASAHVAKIHSLDGGLSWSRPRCALANEGRWNTMCPTVLNGPDGQIELYYLVQNSWADAHLRLRRSRDGGRTWSTPRRCTTSPGFHVVNNARVVRLTSGRLIVPAAWHRRITGPRGPQMDMRAITVFYLSDDGGRTWREGQQWCALAEPASGSGLQEPGVSELPDGRLWAWARTDLGQQWSMHSDDRGESWTSPIPSIFTSPCAPLSVQRLRDGRYAACWCDRSGRYPISEATADDWGRTPLVLALSTDGVRWGGHRIIDDQPGRSFSYPALHDLGDGHVLVAYGAGGRDTGHPLNTLRVRRIDL